MTASATPEIFEIDWRDLRRDISAVLRDGTGILHVRVEDPSAPVTTFIRVATEIWLRAHWPEDQTVIINVDPTDSTLRTPSGLAARVIKECAIQSAPTQAKGNLAAVNILDDIRSRGPITLSNNEVNVELNFYNDWRSGEPLDVLRAGLAAVLQTKKVLLIFRDMHLMEDRVRTEFGREIWKKTFLRFKHSGVIFLCLFAQDCGLDLPDDCQFPPSADAAIDLPVKIGIEERPAAVNDVAGIAMTCAWFETPAEASAFADGQVVSAESMRWLHTKLRAYDAYRHSRPDAGGRQ